MNHPKNEMVNPTFHTLIIEIRPFSVDFPGTKIAIS
jgi:hypothetical protein